MWLRSGSIQCTVTRLAPLKSGAISASVWVYARSRPPRGTIIKNWVAVHHGQFHFGLRRDDGTLEIQIRQANKADVILNEKSTPFRTGKWVQVAFVCDGQSLRLYRDGQEVAGTRCGPAVVNDDVKWLSVGYKAGDNFMQPSLGDRTPGYWDGTIDDLAVLSRALSTDEVRILHASSDARP